MDREVLSALILSFRSVAGAMARDTSKYAVAGVLVDPQPHGTRLVASDGHCLCIALVRHKFNLSKGVVLPEAAVKAITAKGKAAPTEVEITDTGCRVTTPAGILQFAPMEVQFPPYRDVVPREVVPEAKVQPVNPSLLAAMTGWSESRVFRLIPTGVQKSRALLVLSPDAPDWMGIVMPISDNDEWRAWPQELAGRVEEVCGRAITLRLPEPPKEVPADLNLPVPVAGSINSARLKVAA